LTLFTCIVMIDSQSGGCCCLSILCTLLESLIFDTLQCDCGSMYNVLHLVYFLCQVLLYGATSYLTIFVVVVYLAKTQPH